MVKVQDNIIQFPKTLEAFLDWQQPNDGVKYEWYNDELVQFEGMKKKQYYIYDILNVLFIDKEYHKKGTLMAEADVMLTPTQMRRPDIAYFSREQIYQGREGIDVIPAFAIEVISPNDQLLDVETKLIEYFKADVKVVWHIIPEQEVVYVYTSRKDVKICFDDDICSAKPVLEDFEISVNDIFKDYKVRQ